MCGIAGIKVFDKKQAEKLALVSHAITKLNHRGPDNIGTHTTSEVALGHARLSIIDTSSSANQPMHSKDGRYTIIFNGEIYNYKELKTQLAVDVDFATESDTEVLLSLYLKHGPKCLDMLNGFFAFAILDNQTQDLFLARDRFGIKPLLYYSEKNFFCFGSEMKAILAFDVPKKIDSTSLSMYFQLNYIPAPHSILEGVKKVMPGQYLLLSGGEMHVRKWYEIKTEEAEKIDFDQAVIKVKQKVEEAVQRRMVSDVPLGSFLSGGVDSSVIATIASKQVDKLNTFSVGYADEPLLTRQYLLNK